MAKQLCTGVVHKSDLGLVEVGLRNAAELNQAVHAFAEIVAGRDLEPEGLLLSELHRGAKIILGGIRDPRFGPLLMIGAGGVLAELLDDVVFRLCPLTREEAETALDGLAVGRLLRGHRGTVYDRDALVETIVDFSELFAASDWLAQADLNPVIVADTPTGGAVIVDAALVLTAPTKE